MRLLRAALCALIVVIFIGSFLPASAAPHKKSRKSAKELRSSLHNVRLQIRQKRHEIRETRKREHKITEDIASVEGRIEGTEGRLRNVRGRLSSLGARKKLLVARIAATEKRLAGRRLVLARRVRENYERGDGNYMEVLLRSRSVHDYLSRSYYVERIVDSDVKLIAGIRADRRQLDADKRELESRLSETKAANESLETTYAEYRQQVDEKHDLLQEVQEDRQAKEEALDELEQSSQEIEQRIQALARTPRGRARALQAWTGSFIRPASGPITSGFGSRFHPILHRTRMHTGVDIGAGYGAPIHAAAGGEVIMAGYMRGYGNTVIVDHGGGVSTLYGHCSSLNVSEGQSVRQGQVIARVGSTGLATGPHLHFEVRHNGRPVNPL